MPEIRIHVHPDELEFRTEDACMTIRLLILPTLAMFAAAELTGAWPWVHWPAVALGSLLGLTLVTRLLFLAAVFTGIVRPRYSPDTDPADLAEFAEFGPGPGGVDVPPKEVA